MYTQEELSKMTNLSVGPCFCETVNKIIDKDEQIRVNKLLNLQSRNTGKHLSTFDFVLYEALTLASKLDIVEEERQAANERAAYLLHNSIVPKYKIGDKVYLISKTDDDQVEVAERFIEEIQITDINTVMYRCKGCFVFYSEHRLLENEKKVLQYLEAVKILGSNTI